VDAVAAAGILVDGAGKRFADEGLGGIYLANEVAKLAKPLETSIVLDAKIWEGPGKSARIPANPQMVRGGGTLHEGRDIATVAAAAGLPVEKLTATIAAYNRALHEGCLQNLDPPRSSAKYAAMAIETPPYYVIPVCAGITYTMGGLRIDADARVLRGDGAVISGLYAAGSTTGGLEGGDVAGYVGGLVKAGVFGLRAAQHAAQSR
jgi:fumarate reductase flavoprotein subunit